MTQANDDEPLCDCDWPTIEPIHQAHCAAACGGVVICGGRCCLTLGHDGGCECIGDTRGEPGSCPA